MHLCQDTAHAPWHRPARPSEVLTPLRRLASVAPLDHCLFIDRDGVLNERRVGGYVTAWSDFIWRHGAIDSLRRAVDAGAPPLVVVTNQSCIGRGLIDSGTVVDIQERMRRELENAGIPLAAWYCCPHRPEVACACRKPLPGMLEACRDDLGVNLERSYLIGDSPSDVAAGQAAGCATWRVDMPDELADALEQIIACERERRKLPL